MTIIRIFILFQRLSQDLADQVKDKLTSFAIVTHTEEVADGQLKEFIGVSSDMADGYLILITADALADSAFNQTIRDTIRHAGRTGKFLIPMLIGEVALPVFLKELPFARVSKYSNKEDLSAQISVLTEHWAQLDFQIKDDRLSREEQLSLKNLLINLKACLMKNGTIRSFPETTRLQAKAFWTEVAIKPILLENEVSKEIVRILETFELIEDSIINCYFLKINAATWVIEDLKEGYSARFHTHDLQGNKRVDYDLFMGLRRGDRLIGFVFQEFWSVLCVFKISDTVTIDQQHGEGVTLKLVRELHPPVPLDHFKEKINFTGKLGSQHPERLFPLTHEQFDGILSGGTVQRAAPDWDKDPSFTGDMNFEDTLDQLDFTNDINSFASVIALEKIKPPLAIGLFGDWGSGKSFFMEKLCVRIKELSDKSGDRYLNNIVQVKFNAWHYSDSNLWASLITHIFEELNDYAQDTKFDEDSVKELYSKLDLATIAITEAEDQVKLTKSELELMEAQQTSLEAALKHKKEMLSMLSVHDIIGVVLKEPAIQAGMAKVRESEDASAFIHDLDDINTRLNSLNSDWKRLREAYELLTDTKGNWWKVLVVVGLLVIFIGLFFFTPFQVYIHKAFSYALSVTGSVLAALTGLNWLKPYLRTLRKTHGRLKSLKQSIQNRADQVSYAETAEIARLQQEITLLSSQKIVFDQQLEDKRQEKEKLAQQINDIGSGKLITSFLAGKSGNEGYHGDLGIISRIRKDFTRLGRLLKQQKAVDPKLYPKGERFQIDRIVLYIDDLDRCSTDIVVKTLEAIHLLLAIDLFVVVVGVDSRWLDTALQEKYSSYLSPEESCVAGAGEKFITSYDYLEKIFQIPFTLKPMTELAQRKLIRSLTESDLVSIASVNPGIEQAAMKFREIGEQLSAMSANERAEVIGELRAGAKREEEEQEEDEVIVEDDELEMEIQERITLSTEEVRSMQDMAFLFGHTPRTVKRYVNIYRIIKAHRSYRIGIVTSAHDYLPTMLLLGVVIGFPRQAKAFINSVLESPGIQLKLFIEQQIDSQIRESLQKLPVEVVRTLNTDMLAENLPLVSRFSFRTHIRG